MLTASYIEISFFKIRAIAMAVDFAVVATEYILNTTKLSKVFRRGINLDIDWSYGTI